MIDTTSSYDLSFKVANLLSKLNLAIFKNNTFFNGVTFAFGWNENAVILYTFVIVHYPFSLL